MKPTIYIGALSLLITAQSIMGQPIEQSWLHRFFSPVPKPESIKPDSIISKDTLPPIQPVLSQPLISTTAGLILKTASSKQVTTRREFRPQVTIPAMKLIRSSRSDALVDTQILSSIGGGISWQIMQSSGGRWQTVFSFSPATFLFSGLLAAEKTIDMSWASTIGFWDNKIMVGGGYDFGKMTGKSRWFGLLSLGISFNN